MIIKQDKNAQKKNSITIKSAPKPASASLPIYTAAPKVAKAPVATQQEPLTLGNRIQSGFPGMKPGLITDIRALMLARTPMPAGGKMIQRTDPKHQANYRTGQVQEPDIPLFKFPMQQLVSADGADLQGSNARMKLYRPYMRKRRR